MIEIFKTNVNHLVAATILVEQIQKNFPEYTANFDLQDCDNILRIKSATRIIENPALISILNDFGFDGEVLPDVPPLPKPAYPCGLWRPQHIVKTV